MSLPGTTPGAMTSIVPDTPFLATASIAGVLAAWRGVLLSNSLTGLSDTPSQTTSSIFFFMALVNKSGSN